jgi:flagellar hook-length control protein FliK
MIFICALAAPAAMAQDAGAVKAALQQKVGDVKQSIAKNQAQLKQYAWTETTEINFKGEDKKRTQNDCQYGPDGKVQKTPIGAPAPPKSRKGVKGKVVANKIDEMKDYMDRVGSLVKRYVPPDAQDIQASFQAGKAALTPGSGELVLSDYVKPGDKVTITFDTATKKLTTFAVATYLDEPKDTVTLKADFSSLPDGTNYLSQSVLNATAKKIQVTTTNSAYHKVGG